MKERKDLAQSRKKELEDTYRVKKRTIDLLPDAENNILKLEVSNSTHLSIGVLPVILFKKVVYHANVFF